MKLQIFICCLFLYFRVFPMLDLRVKKASSPHYTTTTLAIRQQINPYLNFSFWTSNNSMTKSLADLNYSEIISSNKRSELVTTSNHSQSFVFLPLCWTTNDFEYIRINRFQEKNILTCHQEMIYPHNIRSSSHLHIAQAHPQRESQAVVRG